MSAARVVKVETTDGSKAQFAIQLEDGRFFKQQWIAIECPHCSRIASSTRHYPTWKSERSAQKEIERFKL